MLIAHAVHLPQRVARDARGQPAAFPRNACAKANRSAHQTRRQRSGHRFLTASGIAAQHTNACPEDSGLPGTSNGLAQKRSQGLSVEECLSAGTGTLDSRTQKPSAIIRIRFRPPAPIHRISSPFSIGLTKFSTPPAPGMSPCYTSHLVVMEVSIGAWFEARRLGAAEVREWHFCACLRPRRRALFGAARHMPRRGTDCQPRPNIRTCRLAPRAVW